MKILAIETSCDETAITLLECSGELPNPTFKIIANSLLSQIDIHKEYGGVFPMLAKREHEKNLPILLEKTLSEAGENLDNPNIDYIAVTAGPGLEPALWAGIVFAESLRHKWSKPLIPVNHMEGHLFAYLFEQEKILEFPAIALLVSGGHTELVYVEGFDKFRVIGKTRDDAVGEAFDKVARLLGLPYPGGPQVSALAETSRGKRKAAGRESPDADREQTARFLFPRPMIASKDYDFSYSGLKTSILYKLRELGEIDQNTKEEIAEAFEDAAIEVLVGKTRMALDEYGSRNLIVGGGVSANKHLKSELTKLENELGLDMRFPPKGLMTDNAIMIGVAAYVSILTDRAQVGSTISAQGNLKYLKSS